ncbi:hypothetical protein PI124_g13922 [Phytophthora idaei]|nr:hypothetical protein PI125_g26100 [Phytophthora idaei]KAG3124351.1 hypothetical protein PI126_g23288 [Phytophthora idaei]KAG3241220.1 hypothetical protein PI124_g13922 [Phytophthora idaei]
MVVEPYDLAEAAPNDTPLVWDLADQDQTAFHAIEV